MHRLRRVRGGVPQRQRDAVHRRESRASQPLPQGKVEKHRRTLAMVSAMDEAGFGACSNHGECEAVCPKGITLSAIAQLNRDYARAAIKAILGGDGAGSSV